MSDLMLNDLERVEDLARRLVQHGLSRSAAYEKAGYLARAAARLLARRVQPGTLPSSLVSYLDGSKCWANTPITRADAACWSR